MKKIIIITLLSLMLFPLNAISSEIAGVNFPDTQIVEGKTLTLNGVALKKALGFIKVYAGGLYLENPTKNSQEIIESKQIKVLKLHYLTSKATSKKIKKGFIKAITKANPKEIVARQKANIDKYASWLDQNMKPGDTTVGTYIPSKGFTFVFKGKTKGTINDEEFIQMYFRYTVGKKADSKLSKGYLGL